VQQAEEALKAEGAEVRVVDLTKIKFNPDGGIGDFIQLKQPQKFDYKLEQENAKLTNNFSDDIKEQIEHLKWCDVVIH